MKSFTKAQKREIGEAINGLWTNDFVKVDGQAAVKLNTNSFYRNFEHAKQSVYKMFAVSGLIALEVGDDKYNGPTETGWEVTVIISWER